MGGTRDVVCGRSKAEVYQKYAAWVAGFAETFSGQYPDPAHKKACKDEMVQDPETGEWILHYRLHT